MARIINDNLFAENNPSRGYYPSRFTLRDGVFLQPYRNPFLITKKRPDSISIKRDTDHYGTAHAKSTGTPPSMDHRQIGLFTTMCWRYWGSQENSAQL